MNQRYSMRVRTALLAGSVGAGMMKDTILAQEVTGTPEATPLASPVPDSDLPVTQVAQLTGPKPPSINETYSTYGVYGCDLGSTFMYHDEMIFAFGDTFGYAGGSWRSNCIAFSTDDDPADGITLDRFIVDEASGIAIEVLPSKKIDFDEMTVIPTYGVAVGDRMFLHYMSVYHWGPSGQWELGHSGLAYSDDGGQTWTKDPDAVWEGDTNFGQVAIVESEGMLYFFGIHGGRYDGMQLARVLPENILDLSAYEYWTGDDWVTDISAATTVIPAPVGELSVRWNSYYNKWILMTLDDPQQQIQLFTADALTGPWEGPRVVARSSEYPALYAPFQFPKWNDGPDIWFAMSLFGPYQVFLMKTAIPDLDPNG